MSVIVNVIGRLGADARLIERQDGSKFLSFRMATDTFKGGERGTTWLTVSSNSTNIAQWMTKGKMVNVVGAETIREYFDQNTNEKRFSRDVNAYHVEFVSIGRDPSQEGGTQAVSNVTTGTLNNPGNTSVPSAPQSNINAATVVSTPVQREDDDLPF